MGRRKYKYRPLPGSQGVSHLERPPSTLKRPIIIMALVSILASAALFFSGLDAVDADAKLFPCESLRHGFQCYPNISHHWGQYSPYFTVPSKIDDAVPEGCEVTFAQILSRHGARDPTAGKTKAYNATITHIHESVTEYGAGYEFIKDYNYTLGADQLSDYGRYQMVNSGIRFYKRYQALARENRPFLRSDGQQRVVESGEKWAAGFHHALVADGESNGPVAEYPYDMVVIPENQPNNTLNHGLCTVFEDSTVGTDAQNEYMAQQMVGIADRLNANLPGANLSIAQAVQVMELCPFETVANPLSSPSPFCRIFTDEDWASYDYLQTLGKWFGYGNGNPLGATQGVGFVNELVARLTRQPVVDHTSTNSTLDADPATFPLDARLYADFSHDNDMAGIYAALGLYNATATSSPPPKTERRSPEQLQGYSAAWSVPFAARMYVEKMRCSGEDEELVRIVVNDRVMALQNCGADDLGRCRLGSFVDSLSFARAGGQWDQCFA